MGKFNSIMGKVKSIMGIVILLLLFTTTSYAYRCSFAPKGGKYCAMRSCYSCKWERERVYEAKFGKSVSSKPKRSPLRGPDHSRGYVKNGLHYPNNMSDELSKFGYGSGHVKRISPSGSIIYDPIVNLPCFYVAPGNSPCKRGSFSKKKKGVSRSRNMKQMGRLRRVQPGRQYVPNATIKMENGRYVLPKE